MKPDSLFATVVATIALVTVALSSKLQAQTIEVTDLAGRTVNVPLNPQRIILGESRYLFALSILDRDNPLQRVVGMLADLKEVDPDSYRQYQKQFPRIDDIPRVGHTSADSFSVERVLHLGAELAIFGVEGHGPNARHAQLIDQLQRAGVAVLFVDFRRKPIVNAPKSIALMGRVFQRDSEAKAFNHFYASQLQRVQRRLDELAQQPAPTIFLHSRVGMQDLCCETMSHGMMATFVDAVRGANVAADLVPGSAGVVNLEYLLQRQPDIYIATAIGSTRYRSNDEVNRLPYIVLGAGISEREARQSFRNALSYSNVRALQAVEKKQAYAIWHHFYNSPLNVVAVQVFAKWLYPHAFADLDPRQTLTTLFEQFQPVPLDGTYWVALAPDAGEQ